MTSSRDPDRNELLPPEQESDGAEKQEKSETGEEASDMPFSGERYSFRDLTGEDKPGNMLFSWLSLIVAVAAVALSFLPPWSAVVGIVAIVLAILSRLRLGYFDGMTIAGMIISIVAIVFGLLFLLWRELLPGLGAGVDVVRTAMLTGAPLPL